MFSHVLSYFVCTLKYEIRPLFEFQGNIKVGTEARFRQRD